MGMKQISAKKTKLCRFLALVIYNPTPSTKKIGFRGVWGLLTWHFNSSRLSKNGDIFKNLSDKKVHKIKKFKKGHISIPGTKGFDIAF